MCMTKVLLLSLELTFFLVPFPSLHTFLSDLGMLKLGPFDIIVPIPIPTFTARFLATL